MRNVNWLKTELNKHRFRIEVIFPIMPRCCFRKRFAPQSRSKRVDGFSLLGLCVPLGK